MPTQAVLTVDSPHPHLKCGWAEPGLIDQVATAFEADAARAQDCGAPWSWWVADALEYCAACLRANASSPRVDQLLGEVGETAGGLAEDARAWGMPTWLTENLEYYAATLAEEFLRRRLTQRLLIEAAGESA